MKLEEKIKRRKEYAASLNDVMVRSLRHKYKKNMDTFNQARDRYYGLRIGDIVSAEFYNIQEAEVIEYGFLDNNRVYIRERGKKKREIGAVAEVLKVLVKVEDREDL